MADRTRRPWTRIHGNRQPLQKKRYYAISKGWEVGIFTDLKRYLSATAGFKEPRARKFGTYEDAQNWLRFEFSQEKARKAAQRRRHLLTQRAKAQKALAKGSPKIKKHLYTLDARRVFALDIEYTGFTEDAEILQVSIVNGLGIVVCNHYFQPEHVTMWDDTIPIHHITPEAVAQKPFFRTYAAHLTHLFATAELIIGYSTMQDIALLHKSGVTFPEKPIYFDVGEAYSYVHATDSQPRTYAKLQDCAAHYGYTRDDWHDSLADTIGTLYCFYALLDDEKALFRLHTFKNQT